MSGQLDMDIKYDLHMSPIPVSHIHIEDLPSKRYLCCFRQGWVHVTLRNKKFLAFFNLCWYLPAIISRRIIGPRIVGRQGQEGHQKQQKRTRGTMKFMKLWRHQCHSQPSTKSEHDFNSTQSISPLPPSAVQSLHCMWCQLWHFDPKSQRHAMTSDRVSAKSNGQVVSHVRVLPCSKTSSTSTLEKSYGSLPKKT